MVYSSLRKINNNNNWCSVGQQRGLTKFKSFFPIALLQATLVRFYICDKTGFPFGCLTMFLYCKTKGGHKEGTTRRGFNMRLERSPRPQSKDSHINGWPCKAKARKKRYVIIFVSLISARWYPNYQGPLHRETLIVLFGQM